MNIYNFSEDKYIKTFDAGEEVRMGSFDLATGAGGPLSIIRVFTFIKDFTALGGSEQMVMKIYPTSNYSNVLYTSSTVSLSDITFDTSDPAKDNFLGYVNFTFSDQQLNDLSTYYPTVTISNYTPSGDNFYIGLAYDYPDPVYNTLSPTSKFYDQSIAMQIFTKQARST